MNKYEMMEMSLGEKLPEALELLKELTEYEKTKILAVVKTLNAFAVIGLNAAQVGAVIDYSRTKTDAA